MDKFDFNEKIFIIESFKKVYTPNDDGHPVYNNGKVTQEDFIKNLTQELNEKFNKTQAKTPNEVGVCWKGLKEKYMREKDEKPYKWTLMNELSFLDDVSEFSEVNAEQQMHQKGAIAPSNVSDSVISEDESFHGLEEGMSSLSLHSSIASSSTISQQQSNIILGVKPQSNTTKKLYLALEGVEDHLLHLRYVNKELSTNLDNLERAIIRTYDAIKEFEMNNSTSNAVILASRITQESLNYEVSNDACRSVGEGLDTPATMLNDNIKTQDDDRVETAGVNPAIACAGVDGRLKVVLQNIRSMRKNFNKFCHAVKKNNWKPDIICLTEVWIGDKELRRYKLDSFKMFHCCNNSYRAGGAVVYTRKNLACSQSKVEFKSADCVHVKVTCDDIAYDFLCIYRPVGKHGKSVGTFLDELDDYLSRLSCANLCVLGDINLDIQDPEQNPKYKKIMSERGLAPLVEEPTRKVRISATCIDHVYVRVSSRAHRAHVLHTDITDHSTVLLLVDHPIPDAGVLDPGC